MRPVHPRHQSGNVILIVLISIFLFAALSFTVSRSNRNASDISNEEAAIAASNILQYASAVQAAVHTMMANGTALEDITFQDPAGILTGATGVSADYANSSSDADKVFFPDGGGLHYTLPKEKWLDTSMSAEGLYGQWLFPKDLCAPDVGAGGVACSGSNDDEELTLMLAFVNEKTCRYINRKLGLDTCGDPDDPKTPTAHESVCRLDATSFVGYTLQEYDGSFADGRNIGVGDTNTPDRYDGRETYCAKGFLGQAYQNQYFFFKVLVPR